MKVRKCMKRPMPSRSSSLGTFTWAWCTSRHSTLAARDFYGDAGMRRGPGLIPSVPRRVTRRAAATTTIGVPMRKLVEATHVSLGGEIGSPHVWGMNYLDKEHFSYANKLLFAADDLLLGRRTYEGLSVAYPAMTGPCSGAAGPP